MKTRDLIARLTEADPSGDLHVTVGKEDIWFAEVLPGYYDGCYQVALRDPALEDVCYNITGAEIRGDGHHVCLNTISLRDILWNEPNAPVTYDCDGTREKYEERIEGMREDRRRFDREQKQKAGEAKNPVKR